MTPTPPYRMYTYNYKNQKKKRGTPLEQVQLPRHMGFHPDSLLASRHRGGSDQKEAQLQNEISHFPLPDG